MTGSGGGILWISSNGDDQRIFWVFEILDSGILGGRKRGQVFFEWVDLSRDFVGIQNNLKISACVSWLRSSAIKVQPNKA